ASWAALATTALSTPPEYATATLPHVLRSSIRRSACCSGDTDTTKPAFLASETILLQHDTNRRCHRQSVPTTYTFATRRVILTTPVVPRHFRSPLRRTSDEHA